MITECSCEGTSNSGTAIRRCFTVVAMLVMAEKAQLDRWNFVSTTISDS